MERKYVESLGFFGTVYTFPLICPFFVSKSDTHHIEDSPFFIAGREAEAC